MRYVLNIGGQDVVRTNECQDANKDKVWGRGRCTVAAIPRAHPQRASCPCAVQREGCEEETGPRRNQDSDASPGSMATGSSRSVQEAREVQVLVRGSQVGRHREHPKAMISTLEDSSCPILNQLPLARDGRLGS